MPISCRVISLCSFFLDSSVTFDTIGHLLLHKKLPPLGLCDTNLLFLQLADSIRELVLIDPLFLPCLCWHLSRFCHHSLFPLPSHCLGVFASCPGPTYFPAFMTLKSALLAVQPCFCGILCWTPHGFLRCCMPKDECAAISMAAVLLTTSLCTSHSYFGYSFSSTSLQSFPSKILLPPTTVLPFPLPKFYPSSFSMV